jgi:hypothetical protein
MGVTTEGERLAEAVITTWLGSQQNINNSLIELERERALDGIRHYALLFAAQGRPITAVHVLMWCDEVAKQLEREVEL